jgi:hypothetical protein
MIERKQSRNLLLFCLLMTVGSLVAGCATQNRMTHLRDTLRAFTQQIRWDRWPDAAQHVEHSTRERWMLNRSTAAKGLKIHEIQVLRVVSEGPRSTAAKVILRLTWYAQQDMKVRTADWVQTWQHGRAGWKLKSEERADGKSGKPGSWP